MATKAKRHTHKYRKVTMGSDKLWVCGLPDCNHFMPKHYEKTVEGKFSFCWECGEQFILDPIAMNMDNPICIDCRNPEMKKLIEETERNEILSAINKDKVNDNENKKQSMEEFLKSIGVK